ncbi:MAG: thiolase family protein [bacterium]
MEKQVAIVACKQTKHASQSELTRERMLYELVQALLKDVGITRDDIDTFIVSSNDFHDGRTISNVFTLPRIGAYMKDETKVEMDGANACLYGVMRILSGQYETALLIGHSLGGSEFRTQLVQWWMFDPVYERQVGLMNELSATALQANAYMMKYNIGERELAEAAAKNLRNAAKNPNALQKKSDAAAEDVLGSRPLYSPLHQLHCYPPTDGACAVLLSSEKKAKKLTDKPVWVRGVGQCVESYYLGERELYRSESARLAAGRAYSMAGIKKPSKEIAVAEITAPFAHQEWIIAEALDLFEEGSGAAVVRDGASEIDGAMPVNPSGGALGAHPFNASGLIRITEAVNQLRGEAGEMQVKEPKTAVVHGQDGICAQSNTVIVLSI